MSLRSLMVGPDAEQFWAHREKMLKSKNVFSKKYHRFVCSKILYKNNASIEPCTQIDGRITFPHGLNGIMISAGAVIGRGCTIFHQVTIGSNLLKDSKKFGSPQIGNNVYIGAGAKIIGNVKIGDNVRIGANCVVVDDIEDNATVVLEKPRIIVSETERDNKFVPFKDLEK